MNLYVVYTTRLVTGSGQAPVLQALKISRQGEMRAMQYLFSQKDSGMLSESLNDFFFPKDLVDYEVTTTHPVVGNLDKWEKKNCEEHGFSTYTLVGFVVGPADGKLFYEDAHELLQTTELIKS